MSHPWSWVVFLTKTRKIRNSSHSIGYCGDENSPTKKTWRVVFLTKTRKIRSYSNSIGYHGDENSPTIKKEDRFSVGGSRRVVSGKGITDSQISWSGEGIKRDKPSSIKMERLLQTHDLMTFTTAPSPSKTLQIKDAKIGLQDACKDLRKSGEETFTLEDLTHNCWDHKHLRFPTSRILQDSKTIQR
jgi:hypothetical protein